MQDNHLERLKTRIENRVLQSDIVDLIRKLVQIPSPTGDELEISEFVKDYFHSSGLWAEKDILPKTMIVDELKTIESLNNSKFDFTKKRQNVYGILKGSGNRKIIFNAHVDTVPEGKNWRSQPFGGKLVNGKIFGRGACDTKGSLAAMMLAGSILAESGIHLNGDLVITAVVGEELGGLGTKRAINRGFRANFAVVGEPTSCKICTAHRGDYALQIDVHGTTFHSSEASKGVNAIYEMKDILAAMKKKNDLLKNTKKHKLLGPPTLTPVSINGGELDNWGVPGLCTVVVDRRSLPRETKEDIVMEIEDIARQAKTRNPQLNADVKFLMEGCSPMETSASVSGVKIMKDVAKTLSLDSTPRGFVGGSDAASLSRSGIPTVLFGPGDLINAHKPDEYVSVKDLVSAAKMYALTAAAFLGSE